MSAFNEIISWAKSLPKWQQSIIRDILEGASFDAGKISDYAKLAINDSELADSILDGFNYGSSSSQVVSLTSVCELNNINNLQDNGELTFKPTGITLIYGQNGTGKSGYSRILKKCCRSRDKDIEILGNVHNPDVIEQSVKIKYQITDSAEEHIWNKTSSPPAALQMIHVFDRSSGEAFLSKDADIQYKPSGMDLLDRLAEILTRVATELRSTIETLHITDLSQVFQEYAGTEVHDLISNFEAPDAKTKYTNSAKITDKELGDIETLSRSIPLKEDSSPEREREKLIKKNDSLQNVRSYFSALHELFSSKSIGKLNKDIEALNNAIKNADEAKRLTFDSDEFLTGTGNEAWKTMWRAAERFSNEYADVSSDFPSKNEGTKCVLCQQPIEGERIGFMEQLGNYINDESQKGLSKTQSVVNDASELINSTLKNPNDEVALLATIEESYSALFSSLSTFVPTMRNAISNILVSLKDARNIDLHVDIFRNSSVLLSEIDGILQRNKASIEQPLDDAEFERQLQEDKTYYANLKARTVLQKHEEIILNNFDCLSKRSQIRVAIDNCNTRMISTKVRELSDKYIIESLSLRFNEELNTITGNRVEAVLVSSGTKQGIPHSKIVLQSKDGQSYYSRLADVLSEGEFRGVSLAGFFAELSLANNVSAIVFDDPVSSLDHIYAGRIAERIAKEACNRQIIVFTHDILFVSYLMDRVDKDQISYITLESMAQAGIVCDGLPFEKLPVNKRIGKLKQMLQNEIATAYKNNQFNEYRQLAQLFYSNLRMAWERAVEEYLFGDVVKRYSREVNTRRLKDVKYTKEYANIVERNMTLCSGFLLHDPASGEEVNFGKPEDIELHLNELEAFTKANKN